MIVLSVAMASFPMILTLIGLRARTPETTAALSTFVQSWGYVISAVGPLLVGVLLGRDRQLRAGCSCSCSPACVVLAVTGWFMTRERYADDEVNRFVPGWSSHGALRRRPRGGRHRGAGQRARQDGRRVSARVKLR